MKTIRNDQRGTSAVEFAIVLPLLVVFVFGIVEFGLIFYNKAMLTNASREAARAGIVYRDSGVPQPEIENAGKEYLCHPDYWDDVAGNCTKWMLVTFGSAVPDVNLLSPECDSHGSQLEVEATFLYDFLLIPDFLAAFFSGNMPGTVDITTTTRMRCE